MLGFLKKRKLKKLNAHLDYMLKEIAESRFSPVSSKELACIMAMLRSFASLAHLP